MMPFSRADVLTEKPVLISDVITSLELKSSRQDCEEEYEVSTPRLTSPFYESLKKKYPRAFKRQRLTSLSSQASDNASICSESSQSSVPVVAKSEKVRSAIQPSSRTGLPPLPPSKAKKQASQSGVIASPRKTKLIPNSWNDLPNRNSHPINHHENTSASVDRNSQHMNEDDSSASVDISSSDKALELSACLRLSKKEPHHLSVTSLCDNKNCDIAQTSSLRKSNYYSSTLSLRSELGYNDLYRTDSTQSLKERLNQNQKSWNLLFSSEHYPFKKRSNREPARRNMNEKNKKATSNLLQTNSSKKYNVNETLKVLAEIQNKLACQVNYNDKQGRLSTPRDSTSFESKACGVDSSVSQTVNKVNASYPLNGENVNCVDPTPCKLPQDEIDNNNLNDSKYVSNAYLKLSAHSEPPVRSPRCSDKLHKLRSRRQSSSESRSTALKADHRISAPSAESSDTESAFSKSYKPKYGRPDEDTLSDTRSASGRERVTFKDEVGDSIVIAEDCIHTELRRNSLNSDYHSSINYSEPVYLKSLHMKASDSNQDVTESPNHPIKPPRMKKLGQHDKMHYKTDDGSVYAIVQKKSTQTNKAVVVESQCEEQSVDERHHNSKDVYATVESITLKSQCEEQSIDEAHHNSTDVYATVESITLKSQCEEQYVDETHHNSTDVYATVESITLKSHVCDSDGEDDTPPQPPSNLLESQKLSGSRSSLMDSFKDSTKKKLGQLRKAFSLEKLNDNSSPEHSNLSGRLKKSFSFKKLFGSDAGKYEFSSEADSPDKQQAKKKQSTSLTSLNVVDSPKHYRKLGKIISVDIEGKQVIELTRPPHGPFGFYIARGNARFNHGVFVSRLGDGLPEHFYAGLLSIGDEILEVSDKLVKDMSLEKIYAHFAKTDKLKLKILPYISRKDSQ